MVSNIEVSVTNDIVAETTKAIRGNVAAALRMEAETILTQAKLIVPYRYGHLSASGQVDGPHQVSSDGSQEVYIGFGDAAVDYAIYVHEDLTKYHAPPTIAKFLEIPVLGAVRGMETRLAAMANRMMP